MPTMEPIDYNIKLRTLTDLENFSKYIKDAITEHISHIERFTAIRLGSTTLRYNDWLHPSKYGVALHGQDRIEVGNTAQALQVAGTILHEMGHMMVGPGIGHGPEWHEACKALGLLNERSPYLVEDFTDAALHVISDAIRQFAIDYPALVYFETEIPKPASQADDYLPFQLEGIRWMLRNERNILLADEMGCGKTVQAMGYINVVHPERTLVICPNNAKLIWKRHFAEWCIHPYEIEMGAVQLFMNVGDVVIMSYEGATRWADALRMVKWDLVIMDEGHNIKNPSAKRSRACYSIRGAKSIIVTGSPIVNYPYEIFPLIHYLDREAWPEVGRFEAQFGSRGGNKFGHNLNRLNSQLRATIMLRRFKRDVLTQLPKKRRMVIEFEVPADIKKLIDEEKDLWNQVTADPTASQLQLLAALKNESPTAEDDIDWAALIETLHSTKRYAFERMAAIAHTIGLAKLPLVIEHLENALESKEKVIVFGHHRDVLTAVADKFAPASVLLLGGNANQAAASMEASDRFSSDDKCRLFVAGVSLASAYSLVGSSTVVFIEEGWVPGIYSQAEDRAHGIGRGDSEAHSMLIQHLTYEDSLDTVKARMCIRKQKSIDRATGRL